MMSIFHINLIPGCHLSFISGAQVSHPEIMFTDRYRQQCGRSTDSVPTSLAALGSHSPTMLGRLWGGGKRFRVTNAMSGH